MTNWKISKLELARTAEYPNGSASRSYLLRLPLLEDGTIDENARAQCPERATVRRFWPNEPDLSGYIIRTGDGWAFSYEIGEEDDEALFHLEDHPIVVGGYLTVTEPTGDRLPFRVAAIDRDYGAG